MRQKLLLLLLIAGSIFSSCTKVKPENHIPASSGFIASFDLQKIGLNLFEFSSLLKGDSSDLISRLSSQTMNSGVDLNQKAYLFAFPDSVTGQNSLAILLCLSDKNQFKTTLENNFNLKITEKNNLQFGQNSDFKTCFSDQLAILTATNLPFAMQEAIMAKIVLKARNPEEETPFSAFFDQSAEICSWTNLKKIKELDELGILGSKLELTTTTTFRDGEIETNGTLQTDEETGPLMQALFNESVQLDQISDRNEPGTLAQIHFQVNVNNLWNTLEKMGKLGQFKINAALMGLDAQSIKTMVNGSYSISLLEAQNNPYIPMGNILIRVGLRNGAEFDKMMAGFVINGSMADLGKGQYKSRWFQNLDIKKQGNQAYILLGFPDKAKSDLAAQTKTEFPSNWKFEPINFSLNLNKVFEAQKLGSGIGNLFFGASPQANGNLEMRLIIKTNKPEQNALKSLMELNLTKETFSYLGIPNS